MKLHPFFTYFGGKYRAAPKYPAPKHNHIVEPFAGSAGYSTRYHDREVTLIEASEEIAGIWDYLIHVSVADVLALPLLEPGQSVDSIAVSQEAKWLIGMWVNPGSSQPKKTLSTWTSNDGCTRLFKFWGAPVRERIASQVDQIRHWQVKLGRYEDLVDPDTTATWFVDPPYQKMGKHYRHGAAQLDFGFLGYVCQSLQGQVIVCENEGADWLPFRHLAHVRSNQANSGRTTSAEVIWTNEIERTESA
jgi:hypothetical protein